MPNIPAVPRALQLTVLLCLMGASSAWPQWAWVDAAGKKVFSDMPPPADVPERSIVSRPSGQSVPASPSAPVVPAPPPSAAEKAAADLAAQKKKAEEAEKAKEQARIQAEAAQLARSKADACQRAKNAMAALTSGTPLRTMNAQGERVFMDEAKRNAEKARLQQIIQTQCVR